MWWLVLLLGVIAVLAYGGLLIYGWPSAKNERRAGNSVVRAWMAVFLVASLLILTTVTLGGSDENVRNILVGGVIAAVSTAVAFYFAAKASDASNATLLKATGLDGSKTSGASTATPLKATGLDGSKVSSSAPAALVVAKLHAPIAADQMKVGGRIDFHFKVTNNGTQRLTGVVIADSLQAPGAADYLWPTQRRPGVLKPKETGTAVTTYIITEADWRARSVKSLTTATGALRSGPDVHSNPDLTTIDLKNTAAARVVGP